jgi:FPC/CPF motif-containing protein YcgG
MFFTNADQISKNFEPYDPSRHPMLGWYKGDDPNVLDWQCYWLVKYGVTAVIPTGSLTQATLTAILDQLCTGYGI